MPKAIEELSGYDKAAIIYDIMGDSVAVNMFIDIPEADLYELRKHAHKIKKDVSIHVKKIPHFIFDFQIYFTKGERQDGLEVDACTTDRIRNRTKI